MANTKIPVELSSTPGIVDNSNATAITIDSSENSTFSGNINLDLATPTVIFKESGAAKFFIGESSGVGGGSGFYDMYAAAGLGQRFFTGAAERMRIDSSGNVGIGTTSPDSMLHLSAGSTGVSGGGSAAITMTNKFDNPDNSWIIAPVRTGVSNTGLEIRDVTDSRTDMVFDGSGNVGIGTSSPYKSLTVGDSDASAWITSGGSNTHLTLSANGVSGAVIFRTGGTNGDPSSTSERMRITSDGKVWIGSSNVTQLGSHFVVVDGSDVLGVYASTISAGVVLQTNKGGANGTDSTTTYLSMQRPDGTVRGNITATGTSGVVYGTTSDYRLKENVKTLENGLDRLKQLKPVEFNWIETKEKEEGFIAHEIEKVFPYAVNGKKDDEKMQSVDYGRITPLLVKAIQEQQEQIEALQSEINELKNS